MSEMLLKMPNTFFLERMIAITMYSEVDVATVLNKAERLCSKSIDMNFIVKIAPDIEANAITVAAPKLIATHEILLNLLELSSGGHIYSQVNTFLIDSKGFITK